MKDNLSIKFALIFMFVLPFVLTGMLAHQIYNKVFVAKNNVEEDDFKGEIVLEGDSLVVLDAVLNDMFNVSVDTQQTKDINELKKQIKNININEIKNLNLK